MLTAALQICAWQEVSPALLPPTLDPEVSPADEWHPQPGCAVCRKPAHVDVSCFACSVTHSVFHVTLHPGHLFLGHTGLPCSLHEPGVPWSSLSALWPANSSFAGAFTSKAAVGTHGHSALRWVFRWLRVRPRSPGQVCGSVPRFADLTNGIPPALLHRTPRGSAQQLLLPWAGLSDFRSLPGRGWLGPGPSIRAAPQLLGPAAEQCPVLGAQQAAPRLSARED